MVKRGRGRPRKITSDNLMNDVDMGGQTKVKSDGEVPYSEDQLPEFFQIYIPSLCSQTMRIPPAFVKNFGREMPTIVTLSRPSAQSWQVNISKISEHWYFHEGWPEFVQENSVEEGDVLTFGYARNLIFIVKVFAINGCRKIVDENTSNETSEPENSKQNEASRTNSSLKSAIQRKSVCRNPSFSLVMSKSYILKGLLSVPSEFWNVYMRKNGSGSGMVTLRINNKSWPVGLTSNSPNRVQFSKGWTKFVKDNSLQNENICTFQLVDRNHLAFKVTIRR
ncbi:hypothetical protein BUALT_Bualt01G0148900 [Buddleja alternifolia]|uniref:TF-B3 domain-containing protein n=1 Tax=Buddleja alternifolia TaxID=168488 RepID=A0AAV6Y9J8_9LAMI|nr:hypothetical protein BUALT_Bualt01G0148900 [Buddleja alternifolia]